MFCDVKDFSWLNCLHCVKSVRTRNYSGPHFPTFGLNTQCYIKKPAILESIEVTMNEKAEWL